MLSNKAGTGRDVTPLFGLSKEELRPIVEEAVGTAVASFEVVMGQQRPEPYGYQADKEIPTFEYVTDRGRTGRVTVFVKHFHRTGVAESQQYHFLQAHDAPVPRMFGALLGPDGKEVLLLEYVETCRPVGTRRELLSMMARFNTIKPSDEYAEWLEVAPWGYAGRLAGAGAALDLIWDHARRGELDQELKEFCSAPKSRLRQLHSFTEEVIAQIEQMPRGLTHTDFSRENTGRRITGELLVMDVEWVCLGPRFLDAAGWIGRPSDDGSFGALQHELGQHYLDEYARWGGFAPSVEEFLDDVRVLRLADIIRYLRWNLDRALGGWEASPADSDERRACCEHLMKTLPTFL